MQATLLNILLDLKSTSQLYLKGRGTMRNLAILSCLALLAGCTTVQYNGADSFINEVSYPKIEEVITVYIGDFLVKKGTIVEENVLLIQQPIDKGYNIPAKEYYQVGYSDTQDFYSAIGVVDSFVMDPAEAIAVKKQESSELCIISIFGGSVCYKGDFERTKRLAESGNGFQQTLIYNGRIGDKINIAYREFNNDVARPAFSNEVEYDLSSSNVIGYKGALLEVVEADNSSITYKLIRNFP